MGSRQYGIISRLFNEFKERGIIDVNGQSIEIIDSDKLEALCMCKSLLAYKI